MQILCVEAAHIGQGVSDDAEMLVPLRVAKEDHPTLPTSP